MILLNSGPRCASNHRKYQSVMINLSMSHLALHHWIFPSSLHFYLSQYKARSQMATSVRNKQFCPIKSKTWCILLPGKGLFYRQNKLVFWAACRKKGGWDTLEQIWVIWVSHPRYQFWNDLELEFLYLHVFICMYPNLSGDPYQFSGYWFIWHGMTV